MFKTQRNICARPYLPAYSKPFITLCPAIIYLNADIYIIGVGGGAFEAALFSGVVNEDERGARVVFEQGVHVFAFKSGLADEVYEYKIELTRVLGALLAALKSVSVLLFRYMLMP